MKITLKTFLITFVLMPAVCFGWPSETPPEGHVEDAGGYEDGDVVASSVTSITSLIGTAQKGGSDQSDANSRLNSYVIFLVRNRNGDDKINAQDEPFGDTVLTADCTDSASTLEVGSAAWWDSSGTVKIGDELIYYSGKTSTSLTGCTRGYNETSASAHSSGDAVIPVNAWVRAVDATVEGSPYDAVGWDSSGSGLDDGTPGDLLQDDGNDDVSVESGKSYFYIIRVVDSVGNTNMESGGTDTLHTHGPDSYVDEDGNAADSGGSAAMAGALEDDEVLRLIINAPPL